MLKRGAPVSQLHHLFQLLENLQSPIIIYIRDFEAERVAAQKRKMIDFGGVHDVDDGDDGSSSGSDLGGMCFESYMVHKLEKFKRYKEIGLKSAAEMLSAFQNDFEPCMNAVCALYRYKISSNKFNTSPLLPRDSAVMSLKALAEYLTTGTLRTSQKKMFQKCSKKIEVFFCDMRNKEAEAVTVTCNTMPVLISHWPNFEKDISDLCTRNVFFKIRQELEEAAMLIPKLIQEIGSSKVYEVTLYSNSSACWNVSYNVDKIQFRCSCVTFETAGWPCSHIFSVMKSKRLQKFPSHCVLNRWMRNAKEYANGGIQCSIPKSLTQAARFGVLSGKCNQICHYASVCDEGYETLTPILADLTERMRVISEKASAPDNDIGSSHVAKKARFGVCDPAQTKQKVVQ
ncbi:OLC1v1030515C1 [Oldenlandia corymbosa var. corymbosa]|uniref:Protein FAR1-RELATED SEQUENCE n=1 Tax=Oldenlandia corymbosa var. corymbosa TaxID=529605 RepID=A0AAV1CHV0_OLDCO|nr:OLC1v1030515C1 [Oldenlandia corymbosa var. corymbosa]